MNKIASLSFVLTHLPEMVASLRNRKRGRITITRHGRPAAVLVSPEELETIEILADKKLMLSLRKAEEDERAQRRLNESSSRGRMRSSTLGKNTSRAEVQDISPHGIWLFAKGVGDLQREARSSHPSSLAGPRR